MHHVVNSILAPFGEPIEARPPVPTAEERIAEREAKRALREQKRRVERGGETFMPKGEDGVQEVKGEEETQTL